MSSLFSRRALLRTLCISGASLAAARAFALDPRPRLDPQEPDHAGGIEPPSIPLRAFGSSGRQLPALGLGCFPLGNLGSEEDAVAIVKRAHADGVRYFDTAPSYADGASERRVGLGLKGCERRELHVATKTLQRDGDAALAELERSLERLGMDYVDCVQLHELHDDLEAAFRKGGVVEALESAREKKKLRGLGFTCHRDPKYALEALERHTFVSALVPVNAIDPQRLSFVKDFLPKARAKGVAVVAMKVYGGGALLKEGSKVSAAELLRWSLAQEGVCVAVPGADSLPRWAEARAAAGLPELPRSALDDIARRVGEHQGKSSEWYKE